MIRFSHTVIRIIYIPNYSKYPPKVFYNKTNFYLRWENRVNGFIFWSQNISSIFVCWVLSVDASNCLCLPCLFPTSIFLFSRLKVRVITGILKYFVSDICHPFLCQCSISIIATEFMVWHVSNQYNKPNCIIDCELSVECHMMFEVSINHMFYDPNWWQLRPNLWHYVQKYKGCGLAIKQQYCISACFCLFLLTQCLRRTLVRCQWWYI